MKQVAHKSCSTDTPARPEPRKVCSLGFLRALVSSLSHRHSPELEGAPPFAPFAKGGLLRPNATLFLLFALSEAKR